LELLFLFSGHGMPADGIQRCEDVTNKLARPKATVIVEKVGEAPLSIKGQIEAYMSVDPMVE